MSRRRRDAAARGDRSASEVAIPGSEQPRVHLDAQCSGQVDGVIAAQAMGFGQISGSVCEVRIETDNVQLGAEPVDPGDGASQRCRRDPSSAMGRGCGRSCLGVDQLARYDRFGTVPQLCGKLGSRFVEHQLDQR